MADIKPEPGRQYVCRVYGRPGEVVLTRVYYFPEGARWLNTANGGQCSDSEVTILRPLYTLDLDDGADAKDYVSSLAKCGFPRMAKQIEAQIPKPARMAEPAWGEKVIAHTKANPERRTFLRYSLVWTDGAARDRQWAELIDPEPYDEASRG